MSKVNGHAAAPVSIAQSPDMDLPRGEQSLQDEKSNIQSADRGSIASKRAGSQRHRDKQNIGYALKTGLAGGLAGCAVGTKSTRQRHLY